MLLFIAKTFENQRALSAHAIPLAHYEQSMCCGLVEGGEETLKTCIAGGFRINGNIATSDLGQSHAGESRCSFERFGGGESSVGIVVVQGQSQRMEFAFTITHQKQFIESYVDIRILLKASLVHRHISINLFEAYHYGKRNGNMSGMSIGGVEALEHRIPNTYICRLQPSA